MLCTLKEILDDAREKKYCVGMFDTFTLESARGVVEAAEETKSPIILATVESFIPGWSLEVVADLLLPIAKRASVPVGVHLDHGFTEGAIKRAIELGFTSIMYDCSTKPFDENASLCAEMVDYAHKNGVSVECELGNVALGEGGKSSEAGYQYTKPKEVEEFVARTNTDALAIAIGTEHGVYSSKPVLNIELIKEIRALTDAALVLHGGSGLSTEDFQNCIKAGIQKMNIYTDIGTAACEASREALKDSSTTIYELSLAMRDAVRKVAAEKMTIFGSNGKA